MSALQQAVQTLYWRVIRGGCTPAGKSEYSGTDVIMKRFYLLVESV
jgi:hypothetical protein